MLQSFLCVSRALLTSEEQMIHSDLLPPPTVRSARLAPGEADLHLKTGCWSAFVPLCVRACPLTLAQIAGASLSCSQRIMRETGRSGGGMKALKFLMRSLVFSLLNLHTSCLRAGWNNQAHHATHIDKLPPLAPPHTLVCHHSRRVPRPFFVVIWEILFPHLPFSLCLYSTEVGGCWRGLLSRKIDLLHINILHLCSIWKRSPWQCRRPAAGGELACCLLPVWVRHIFSLWLTCLSVMCLCSERQPLPTP